MPFFTFYQNNSGGRFDYDAERGISQYVIFEADDKDAAVAHAEGIGLYFDGVDKGWDCACCGDRWYAPDAPTEHPTIYGTILAQFKIEYPWIRDGYQAFVHRSDGTFAGFFKDNGKEIG